ncbi:MAG: bifunctional tRNA (5-methylaminomethyl-2-thiouridine)(34)-methyltransferase MnmD/FAD-dependent 5-carboxymethylaminomethyl-2-thiouridine(34) oxidoreductase MnmC [Motiliproteus sp.]
MSDFSSSSPSDPTANFDAQLDWDKGQPLSQRFNDYYFSRANGLEESRYVFLQHNQLQQRWQALHCGETFVIAETGFGTALNFLCCWQRWIQLRSDSGRLHFISIERFPLNRQQLQQALALWPELAPLALELLSQYPDVCQGSHRLHFDQGRISLTLIFDDACQVLERLDSTVDAWFLDGFSPDKNPQMWTPELFRGLARCSHQGTTFSTFTAASAVRRGLQQCQFEVKRATGYGKKREMLYGQYLHKTTETAAQSAKPWFDRPFVPTLDSDSTITVIGAGIAGASSAFALAQRGYKVDVIERGSEPGSGASGNPQGVLYAKLPAIPTLHSRIHLSGYLYSLRLLHQQLDAGQLWQPCGVLQLALDPKQTLKNKQLLNLGHYPQSLVHGVDPQQASQIAGIPLSHGGLFYPDAGWVSPAELCRRLLDHPNIRCRFNQPVDTINFDPDRQQWALKDSNGSTIGDSSILIVANAHDARQFSQLTSLPLKPIRGQTTSVRVPAPLIEASGHPTLKTVLCGNGYLSPAKNDRYCFGASFNLHNSDPQIDPQDHQHNLELVRQMSPDLAQQLAPQLESAQGRVGFRCAASDYLPIAGAVANEEAYLNDYGQLRKDAKTVITTAPSHHKGLFINVGHGSKGMITAPLCGELLADLIEQQPLAIEPELANSLNPARFIIKKLIKGTI